MGDSALDHRALLLTPLSLPLSSHDLHCQIIEKRDLENYVRDLMTRPGGGLCLLSSHFSGQDTVDGANLTAHKAGESHHLVGQGQKETIWRTHSSVLGRIL